MARAASPHLRKHWRMQREDAATAGMRVIETADGNWKVTGPGAHAGPFATQADAYRWIDKQPSRRYGQ